MKKLQNRAQKKVQEEVKWVNLPFIKTSVIKFFFDKEKKKTLPNRKHFGFYRKINENEKGKFSESELEIIANIRKDVNDSLKKGDRTFIFDKFYIQDYLIPELERLYETGVLKNKMSIKYASVRTCFDLPIRNDNITVAHGFAKNRLKSLHV